VEARRRVNAQIKGRGTIGSHKADPDHAALFARRKDDGRAEAA
jgi:hypothetical protein